MWIVVLPEVDRQNDKVIIVEVKGITIIEKERDDLWCIKTGGKAENAYIFFNPQTSIIKIFYEPLGFQSFLKNYLDLMK